MSPEMVTAIGAVLSAIAAGAAVIVALMVYRGQRLLSQRQLIVPLWDYVSKLDNINPTAPITPDAIRAINTLELIALCVEGGMIDPRVIKRTFRDEFIRIYDKIEACGKIQGMREKDKRRVALLAGGKRRYKIQRRAGG